MRKVTISNDEWMQAVFADVRMPEGAFTVQEAMKKSGISRSATNNLLDGLVKKGELKKGKCILEGKHTNWYIRIK